MSAVQLEVRLVGDDPEQQKAFDRAANDAAVQANHSAPADGKKPDQPKPDPSTPDPQRDLSVDAFVTALDEVLAAASKPKDDAHTTAFNTALDEVLNASDADKSSSDAFLKALDDVLSADKPKDNGDSKPTGSNDVLSADKPKDTKDGSKPTGSNDEHEAINSIEQLIEKIDELISSDRVQKGPKKETQEKEPQTEIAKFLQSLDAAIQGKIDAFGLENASAGRIVSRASRTVAKFGTKLANSKVGKSIAGALGRGAAAAGTEAAGAGASAGAAAGGIGAAAAIAGPLASVALGAGAAALTLKQLTDAVQSAANELTDLSPALASVRAQYQVQHELARLDRADRIGAGAAQLEAARSRISESMYEVQTKILEVILKFAPLLEAMLDGVNVAVRLADVMFVAPANQAAALRTPGLADDVKALQDAQKSMDELVKSVKELVTNGVPPNGAIDPFLGEILNIAGNPPPLPRLPRAGGRP